MNNFIYENKTKVYFGKNGVKDNLSALLANYGNTVLLAYGGGSIKRNGVYDEVTAILHDAGKTVIEFSGIMPNPTYAKVQEGAKLARDNHIDLILAVGGGSVSDCCKIVSAQANLDEDIWEMQTVKHALPN
ncbi:MAG: iron-containing alcohol dehydrogenase, partial [Butyricicoccus sp.]